MVPPIAFISYSRKDSDFALKISEDLRKLGVQIWLDQLDIPPGQQWDNEIQTQLKNCNFFLIILSKSSIESQSVLDEVSFALSRGKKIIPVLTDNCEIPFRLQRLQYIDFRTNYEKGLNDLLVALKQKTKGAPPPGRLIDDELVWREKLTLNSIKGYKDYVFKFPIGIHKDEALFRIKKRKRFNLVKKISLSIGVACVLFVLYQIVLNPKIDCASLKSEDRTRCYINKANNGDTASMFYLGEMYNKGAGLDSAYLAKSWYSKAAVLGHPYAMYQLADIYLEIEDDSVKSYKWYLESSEKGNSKAMNELGILAFKKLDFETGFHWFTKSAEKADINGMLNVGYLYLYGQGVPQNSPKGIEWLIKAAKKYHVTAMDSLGKFYTEGRFVTQDSSMGYNWYKKAADRGSSEAMVEVGRYFLFGKIVKDNDTTAFNFFHNAAVAENVIGMYYTGECYDNGWGCKKDPQAGFKWHLQAANQAFSLSMYKVGEAYYEGNIVEKDPQQAYYWLAKSAMAGDGRGMFKTGECYYYSIGVKGDYKQAFYWYGKAVKTEPNFNYALYSLGYCYYNGQGIDPDEPKGIELMEKAAILGSREASKFLDSIRFQ